MEYWLLVTRHSHGLQKWVPNKRSLRNGLDVVVVKTPVRYIQNQNVFLSVFAKSICSCTGYQSKTTFSATGTAYNLSSPAVAVTKTRSSSLMAHVLPANSNPQILNARQ